jgi:hypothetical protein
MLAGSKNRQEENYRAGDESSGFFRVKDSTLCMYEWSFPS